MHEQSLTAAPVLPPRVLRPPAIRAMPPLRLVPYLCLALVALADWFFVQAAPRIVPGWIIGGFAGATLLAVAATTPGLLGTWTGRVLFALNAGLAIAMIEQPSLLAAVLFLFGLATFILSGEADLLAGPGRWAFKLIAGGMLALARATDDAMFIIRRLLRAVGLGGMVGLLGRWALPGVFTLVFVALFAGANPLLNGWLQAIDLRSVRAQLPSLDRLLFWLLIGGICWTVLRASLVRVGSARAVSPVDATPSLAAKDLEQLLGSVFSTGAVIRSMIVFNVLFAAQNGMDMLYLWGGRALPVGQTYAGYAHASAYPLIVTALIAAAFVLIAFRPGTEPGTATAGHPLSRPLMYLWVAQNIVLVASAVWRTCAYIGEYSLTHLRLAALVWMALVAFGLALMMIRFAFDRSNRWLLNANIVALVAVLYAACFVNSGGLIADYNVRSCGTASGCTSRLDIRYLYAIGVPALPALKRATLFNGGPYVPSTRGGPLINVAGMVTTLEHQLQRSLKAENWRSWTWSRYRLSRQLSLP